MRSYLTAENDAFLASRADSLARLVIWNQAGNPVTYAGRLLEATFSENIDDPVSSLRGTFAFHVPGALANLSPFTSGGGAIDESRRLRLEESLVDASGNAIQWRQTFDGRITDFDLTNQVELAFDCLDWSSNVQEARIKQKTRYAATPRRVDLVMQDILTQWAPGWTLFVPTVPLASDTLQNYEATEGSVLDTLRSLALERLGWDVAYRWDDGTSQFRLTLVRPDRSASSPVYTFGAGGYRNFTRFAKSRRARRNHVEVPYGNGTQVATSISTGNNAPGIIGELYMRTAPFDPPLNLAQAQTVADAIRQDLEGGFIEASFDTFNFPFVQLNDLVQLAADGVRFDSAQNLAVVTITRTWQAGKCTNTYGVRGRPAGAYGNWIDRDGTLPGNPPPSEISAPEAPTGFGGSFTGRDALVTWTPPAGQQVEGYEVRVLTSGNTLLRTIEIPQPPYSYSFDQNVQDGGPRASLNFQIRAVRTYYPQKVLGNALLGSLTNLAPSAPASVALIGEPLRYRASVPEPTFADYLRTEWQSDDNSEFTSPTSAAGGPDWQGVSIGLEAGTSPTHVRARFVDVFGQASGWTAASLNGVLVGNAHIAAQAVGVAQFAANIRPVGIGSTLPAHPYAGYVEGDLFMLVVGGAETMHRLTNPAGAGTSGWTLAVGSQDIQAGAITTGKIAAGAVTATELAAFEAVIGRLAVGDWSNLVLNPDARNGSMSGWVGLLGTAADVGSSATHVFLQHDRDAYYPSVNFTEMMPCEPGRHYFVQCRQADASPVQSNYPFSIGLFFRDAAGGIISWQVAATQPTGQPLAWRNIGGIIQAPANAARMAVWTHIQKPAGTELDRHWRFTQVVCRRAMAGELIVDGAITANKITALELNAIQGTFGGGNNKAGLDNRGLRVYDSSSVLRVAAGDVSGLSNGIGGSIPANTYGIWLAQNSFFNGQISADVLSRGLREVFEWTELLPSSIGANSTITMRQLDLGRANAFNQLTDYRFCVVQVIFKHNQGDSLVYLLDHHNDGQIISTNEGSSPTSNYYEFDFSTTQRIFFTRVDQFTPRYIRLRIKNTSSSALVGLSGFLFVRMIRFLGDGSWPGFY